MPFNRAGIATKAAVITPSNTTQQNYASIYVGGAGTVAIEPEGMAPGTSVSFTVPAGGYILCACNKVLATGTTATLMVGLS